MIDHQATILSKPLVPVGGVVRGDKSVLFCMHEGYDRPAVSIEAMANLYLDAEPGCYRAGGGSWPIYARVEAF